MTADVRGMPTTTTRAPRRAVSLIAVLLGVNVAAAGAALASHGFSDVPSDAYYHDAVEWARTASITAGCGDGKYCPDDPVTRGQMAVFLQKMDKRGFASSRLYVRSATVVGNGSNVNGYVLASCDAGDTLLGGGFLQTWNAQSRVLGSFAENYLVPNSGTPAVRWAVMYDKLAAQETISASASCLNVE